MSSSPRFNAIHLCYGRHDLFDSTDPGDHMEAAKLCRQCPLLQTCRGLLKAAREATTQESGHGPQGTWAGEAVGKATTRAHRMAIEETMFSEVEANDAAAEYKRGIRTDRNRIGARVYQRRLVQRQRERRAERDTDAA